MTTPSAALSAIVIGGGVVGLATALALQERGFAVTVSDLGGAMQPASWGNAGRIAVEQSAPLASLATLKSLPGMLFSRGGPVAFPARGITAWLPFGLRLLAASSPKRYAFGERALAALLAGALPAWRTRLSAMGAAHLLIESGHYSVWENPAAYANERAAWYRNAGAATPNDIGTEDMDRLKSLLTVPLAGAMAFTGTASIADPGDLLALMKKAFLDKGGHIEAQRLTVAEAIDTGDRVIVTAGIGSAALLAPIGHHVPIIAERGYHIHQPDALWPDDLPSIFFEDRSLVLTRFRSGLRATSFVEFTHAGAPPDARKWKRLQSHVGQLGLPFDDRATKWHGSRPTLPDYLPAIGRSKKCPQVFYAFGHHHLGLTLAAITGDIVADLLCDKRPALDMAPYDLDRFSLGPGLFRI